MRGRMVGMAVAAVFLLAPASVAAQNFELGANGGLYMLSGDDFEDVEAGFGVDVTGRFYTSADNAFGIGGQWNQHGFEGTDIDMSVLSLYGEFRHNFATGGTAMPFLSGRAGFVRASADVDGSDASQNGFGVGATGGLVFNMIEVSALLQYVSLGEADFDGTTIPDSEASGWVMGIRAGIVVGGGGM